MIDPCLRCRNGVHLPDLFVGNTIALEEEVTGIKNKYPIEETGNFYEYVGSTIIPDAEWENKFNQI